MKIVLLIQDIRLHLKKMTIKINVDASPLDSLAPVGVIARNSESIPLAIQILRGRCCSIKAVEEFAMLGDGVGSQEVLESIF